MGPGESSKHCECSLFCSETLCGSVTPLPKAQTDFLSLELPFLLLPKHGHQPQSTLQPPLNAVPPPLVHLPDKVFSSQDRDLGTLLVAAVTQSLLPAPCTSWPHWACAAGSGNCVHFLSLPWKKPRTDLDTNSGPARDQSRPWGESLHLSTPQFPLLFGGDRTTNLKRLSSTQWAVQPPTPGLRTLTQLLTPHPTLLPAREGEATDDRKGQQGGGRMCGGRGRPGSRARPPHSQGQAPQHHAPSPAHSFPGVHSPPKADRHLRCRCCAQAAHPLQLTASEPPKAKSQKSRAAPHPPRIAPPSGGRLTWKGPFFLWPTHQRPCPGVSLPWL